MINKDNKSNEYAIPSYVLTTKKVSEEQPQITRSKKISEKMYALKNSSRSLVSLQYLSKFSKMADLVCRQISPENFDVELEKFLHDLLRSPRVSFSGKRFAFMARRSYL